MDCEMPIKNGFEASREIVEMINKRKIKEVPIIACTAFVGNEQRNKCFDSGMRGFLNKPIIIDDLKNAFKNCGLCLI